MLRTPIFGVFTHLDDLRAIMEFNATYRPGYTAYF